MKLEVFYDYSCPFCKRGYKHLLNVLPDFPEIQVEWRPCEAHPRPERYGYHSDLCARGMYIAQEQGVDLALYHQEMYKAALNDKKNIEDIKVLTEIMCDYIAPHIFGDALITEKHQDRLDSNNTVAWEHHQFLAVPSLVLNGEKLSAVENIGLREEDIRQFLHRAVQ